MRVSRCVASLRSPRRSGWPRDINTSQTRALSGVSAVSRTVDSQHKGTPSPQGFWGSFMQTIQYSVAYIAQNQINPLSEQNLQSNKQSYTKLGTKLM
jgi:hypothetical protein